MEKPTVLFVLGTRPEAIKCAPVIRACLEDTALRVRVLTTSQHRELQDNVLEFFGIHPDHDLALMGEKSDLNRLVGEGWAGLAAYFQTEPPNLTLTQGDTTTAFLAALAAQYHRIPVGHIEAGLRTFDKSNPFPEEINRRLIAPLADLHFAPTTQAKENLLKENIDAGKIFVVGNPGIDALLYAVNHLSAADRRNIRCRFSLGERYILVTSHRRENWGENLQNLCRALREIVARYSDIMILFLVHPNPEVSQTVHKALSGIERIVLQPAVPYLEMAALLSGSLLALTDSGGIQEEAPALGKPVLVLREKTERPEGVEAHSSLLVGTDPERILSAVNQLLSDAEYYRRYSRIRSPYGDGRAAQRIHQGIRWYFHLGDPPDEIQDRDLETIGGETSCGIGS